MRIGYQGEPHSYSYRATAELFPNEESVGLYTFFDAFVALEEGRVDRLVLPVENSTTGSVLPVLDPPSAMKLNGRVSPFSSTRQLARPFFARLVFPVPGAPSNPKQ